MKKRRATTKNAGLTESAPSTLLAAAHSPSISHAGLVTKVQVSKGNDEEVIEKGRRLVDVDAGPDLVCYGVEKPGLICVLEVLDGVEILERTGRGYRVLRHTVVGNKTWLE